MIRINLLAVERGPVKRAALIPAAHRVTIAAGLILVLTVGVIGAWFWSMRRESQQVDQDITRAETEIMQLRSVLVQVQKFEAQRAQLQQRVTLIEQLRQGQTVPVQVLDHVSRSLPDMLWLTDLKQEGPFLTIEGRTTTLIGLSDFVGNLGANPVLRKPIEILDSGAETVAAAKNDATVAPELIQFKVRAALNGLPPEPEETGKAKTKTKTQTKKGAKS